MKLTISFVTTLVVMILSVAIARAESGSEEAKRWLARMVEAARNLDYEGTFVYVQGQNLEAMHIIHAGSRDGRQWQRLSSLNGTVREVLVEGNYVTCLLSQQKLAFNVANYSRGHAPFPLSFPSELSKLEENYQFELRGDDRVAGMETQIVAIKPRDQLRFGYRLWLERQSGMLLRSSVLNENGDAVEQLMFTNVRLKPEIDPTLLTPPALTPSSPPAVERNTVVEKVVTSDWSIAHIPPGFSQVMDNRFRKNASSKHLTEHLLLTDGLATVSVFVEALDGTEPLLRGASQIGAMNAYGVVIADHQVVVVGEVPSATVEMIVSSIRHSSGAARK
jgi:sigma-E factor negative regulatory protein RseB